MDDDVAGIDEAGRGPLAGPVVTAAVILDPDAVPDGLNDSKQLTMEDRERLFPEILRWAQVSIASSSSAEIDRLNHAGHQAILDAILARDPDEAETALRRHLQFAWELVRETLGTYAEPG